MKQFVFKKDPSNSGDDRKILQHFKECLHKQKNQNAWLLRESRQAGMISLSYLKEGKVIHQRFAFIHNKWHSANDEQHAKELGFVPINSLNMGMSIYPLFDQIEQKLSLTRDNILIPTQECASKVRAYMQDEYTIEIDVFKNPLEVLARLQKQFEDKIKASSISLSKLPEEENLDLYEHAFLSWLESKRKEDQDINDLYCPITHEVFKNPVILSSKQIFEYSEVLDSKGQHRYIECPLSNMRIKPEETRTLDGYHRAFRSCLKIFAEWHRLQKALEQQTLPSAYPVPAPQYIPRLYSATLSLHSPLDYSIFAGTSAQRTESKDKEMDANPTRQTP
jgi:hypothetical protein